MNQKKNGNARFVIWTVIALLAVLLLVPSAMVVDAGAEEEVPEETILEDIGEQEVTADGHVIGWTREELPEYEPVELENPDAEPLPMGEKKKDQVIPAPYAPHAESFLPDREGYVDSTISVRIETRIIMNTKVFFTFVQIADPSQLRTYSIRNGSVKDNAEKVKSVLAVNGDWYTAKEKKGNGVIWRNGVRKRNVDHGIYDGLFIDRNGDFHILRHPKKGAVADAPFADNIMHSFVFGPALVIDGEIVHLDGTPGFITGAKRNTTDEILARTVGSFKSTQRAALCQMGPLSYLIITTEGPEQSEGGGFSTDQMARLAWDMGAQQAFNIDGGTSAQLVIGTERLNALGNGGKSNRAVGDMIFFATAEP